VPYQLVRRSRVLSAREIKDILAYLQLLNNPRDACVSPDINTPVRGIGKTTTPRSRNTPRRKTSRSSTPRARRASFRPDQTRRRGRAKFVALYDELGTHIDAPVEEIVGHVFR